MTSDSEEPRVALVAEGAVWGGIESYLEVLGSQAQRQNFHLEIWLLYEGLLQERLARWPGISTRVIPARSHLGRSLWMRRRMREQCIQVLHAHGMVPEILCAISGYFNGARLVSTVHSAPGRTPFSAPGRSLWSSGALWLARRSAQHRIVAVTAEIAEILTDSGLSRSKIRVVPNSVSLENVGNSEERATFRRSDGVGADDFVVGIVGRLDPIKGHRRLFGAALALAQKKVPIRVWVIGEGPIRRELEDFCQQRGLTEIVRFWGFREDVKQLMPALDVGVFCSDHEGMPFAALELQAAGVPLVARDVGGLSELVSHNRTGLLYPPNEPIGLARSLESLYLDRHLAAKLADGAQESLRATRSAGQFLDRTAEVWTEVLRP